jgi:uncharacterized protein DUF5995
VLSDLVAGRRAATIEQAVDIMTGLDRSLSDADGLKWFNRLYLQVTLAVRDAVTTTTFLDPDFLATLDVVFANLYFDAVAAGDVDPARAPSAWRPLFECRHRRGIRPLQFALAGMNAHICHDLPLAVVHTCQEIDVVPACDTPQHTDFTRTNDVLADAQEEIKLWFSSGVIATVDRLGGRVDDGFAAFGIHTARAAAWTTSEILWGLTDNPRLDKLFRGGLRRTVELTSRGILL